MSSEDDRSWAASLKARVEERFAAPFKRNAFATRTWFLVTLAAILALHGAVLAFLLYRDAHDPVQTAKVEETPVEVIVEKPPEPPKPPPEKPQPKPQQKPELEKPASSAPRAENTEKTETEQTDKETHAPKAATPPKDGKPEPSRAATSPTNEPAKPDTAQEEAAQKELLDKDAEALDKAVPEPPKKPQSLVAKVKPPAKVHKEVSALDQLAGDSALPDYSFARPTKKSPVSGGTEDARYLAIVYGLIMRSRHSVVTVADANGNVTIAFDVDSNGRLIGADYVHRSGYPEIDAEAMAAIRRASPFPPPPPGAPHGLVATIDFSDTGRRAQ